MIRAVALLLALAAMPAIAADGFFRHQESPAHEAAPIGASTLDGALCTLVIRYNNARPDAQEITYKGPQALCVKGYETALHAATPSVLPVKVTGPIDPLTSGPGYECTILVSFGSLDPTSALASFLGVDACASTRASAFAAARQNMLCVFECNFG